MIKFVSVLRQWFSPGIPISSTIKTNRLGVTEILLKAVLNTKNQHRLFHNKIVYKAIRGYNKETLVNFEPKSTDNTISRHLSTCYRLFFNNALISSEKKLIKKEDDTIFF